MVDIRGTDRGVSEASRNPLHEELTALVRAGCKIQQSELELVDGCIKHTQKLYHLHHLALVPRLHFLALNLFPIVSMASTARPPSPTASCMSIQLASSTKTISATRLAISCGSSRDLEEYYFWFEDVELEQAVEWPQS